MQHRDDEATFWNRGESNESAIQLKAFFQTPKKEPRAWPRGAFMGPWTTLGPHGAMDHPRPHSNSGGPFYPIEPLEGSAFGRPET